MAWFLFILLNAAFFIRPGDLVQSADFPVYNVLMIACLALAFGRLSGVLRSVGDSPVTGCVLAFVSCNTAPSASISHVCTSHEQPAKASTW